MKIVSRLLPKRVRHRLRRGFDSLYSKQLPDKETIGVLSQWTIVTRDMRPGAVIYSGGVGEDITFEQELIRRFGVKINIFDPSPVAQRTIALANSDHLLFQPVGLSASPEQRLLRRGRRRRRHLVQGRRRQDRSLHYTSL